VGRQRAEKKQKKQLDDALQFGGGNQRMMTKKRLRSEESTS
jgi:hypothetical protein